MTWPLCLNRAASRFEANQDDSRFAHGCFKFPESGSLKVPSLMSSVLSDPSDESELPTADSQTDNSQGSRRRIPWKVAIKLAVLFLFISIVYGVGTAPWRWNEAMTGFKLEHRGIVFGWFIRSALTEVLVFWWVLAICGSLGSFLNVVVYRMPRGISLSASGSRCVHCGTGIKWYDNQPVIGWLLLQGRCRSCDRSISGRYPLVEFSAAVLGLGLFLVTVQTTLLGPSIGRAAQNFSPDGYCFWLLDAISAQGLVNFFYLLPTLMACLAIAWASYDRVRLPSRFYLVTGFFCVGGSVLYELVLGSRLTEWYGRHEWSHIEFLSPSVASIVTRLMGEDLLSGLFDGSAHSAPEWVVLLVGQSLGIGFGSVFGWTLGAVARLFVEEPQKTVLSQSTAIFALLGVVGGWYLPLVVGVLWSIEFLVRQCWQRWRQSQATRSEALLFMLPYYYLVAVAIWRWFP